MSKPPSPSKGFPKALRMVRILKGISQEEMEPAASNAYMGLLETGRRSPTLKMIEALAARLSIHPATLVLLAFASQRDKAKANTVAKRVYEETVELIKASHATTRLPRRKKIR